MDFGNMDKRGEKKPAKGTELVVLHQGAIGDFVLALSVVQAARAQLRPERVVAIAAAGSARLAAGRSAIDVWQSPEHAALHSLFREDGGLDGRLTSLLSTADCVLSFLSSESDQVHQRLRGSTRGRVVSIDPRPSAETLATGQHITSQWRRAIGHAGLDIGDPEPPVIHVDSIDEAASGGWGTAGGGGGATSAGGAGRRIIFHPGSGGQAKCWPMDYFIALVQSLRDLEVTWMLGPAEYEAGGEWTAAVQRRVASGRESLLVEDDLFEAARRIPHADLYVGNDAGMTHIAAAMGVPTIAIFGPTDPRVWRPLGDHVTAIGPAHRGDPIAAVSIEQVKAAARKMVY